MHLTEVSNSLREVSIAMRDKKTGDAFVQAPPASQLNSSLSIAILVTNERDLVIGSYLIFLNATSFLCFDEALGGSAAFVG